eukprot:gene6275-7818_t
MEYNSPNNSNNVGGKPILFRNMLLLLDTDFSYTLIENFCKSVSSQKTSEIFNSLISLLDEHYLELMRIYIKANINSSIKASEGDSNSFLSFQNIINRMASAYLKIHLGNSMEKILSTQMATLSPAIQDYIMNLPVSPITSPPINTSPITTPRTSINTSLNSNTIIVGSSIASLSSSNITAALNGLTGPSSSSSTSQQQLTSSTTSTNNGILSNSAIIEDMHGELCQCAITIINTIFKSQNRFPSHIFQLFQLLYGETVSISQNYPIELIKKIFFTKLVCPVLANLKPPHQSSPLTPKIFIEISKIVSDIIFEKETSLGLSAPTGKQINDFIKTLVLTRSTSNSLLTPQLQQAVGLTSNPSSSNLTSSSSGLSTNNNNINNSSSYLSKDEACAYFIHYLKTESLQLDKFFQKAKEQGVPNADRNLFLFGVFKDFLNSLKNCSFSNGAPFPTTKIGAGTTASNTPTIRGISRSSESGSSGSSSSLTGSGMGHSSAKIIQFSKKWSSDELKASYNGKSHRKRSQVLEKKFTKTQIVNVQIHTDSFMVTRTVSVPLAATVKALGQRIQTDSEFSDLTFGKEDYEMAVRYGDDVTVISDDGSPEVVCEPELPLWMYDIDHTTTLVFRPEKKRASSSFCIFVKCIFPCLPIAINPIVMFVNLQSTPQSIIDDKLLKHVIQIDPTRLGFFLCNIDESNPSSLPIQVSNDRVLAGNKISTMDIIECNYRHAYELSLTIDGKVLSTLVDYDLKIESVTQSLASLYQSISSNEGNSLNSSQILSNSSSGQTSPLSTSTSSTTINNTSPTLAPFNISNLKMSNSRAFDSSAYSMAIVCHSNQLPMFLPNNSKLSNYSLAMGDEILLTNRTFVSLVEGIDPSARKEFLTKSLSMAFLGSSSDFKTSMAQSLSTANSSIKARFKITWVGPIEFGDQNNLPSSFNNTLNNSLFYQTNSNSSDNITTNNNNNNNNNNISSSNLISSPTLFSNNTLTPPSISHSRSSSNTSLNAMQLNAALKQERPLWSHEISQDLTVICNTKYDYCINNQVKLCIVGEETPEKMALFNAIRKQSVKSKDIIEGSDQIMDLGLRIEDWVYGQETDHPISFKMFYFNGLEIYNSNHSLFISPESIFVITYNPNHLNLSTIEYWLEIIQTKSSGSLVYLVGVTMDDKKSVTGGIRMDDSMIQRFNNIVNCINISCRNIKQIRHLSNILYSVANQKQFQSKIPFSYVILRNQCLESGLEARRLSKIPISSLSSIKSISKHIGLETKDVENALKYLYSCGDILFYKQEGNNEVLADIVFLDGLWMAKLVSSVFTLKHQNGMLLIDKIRSSWEDKFPIHMHTSLIFILEKFEIMHSSFEDSSLIVPTLFSEERPNVMRDLWPTSSTYIKHEYQRIYEFQFLPKGFFSRLSVRMLQNYDPLCIWQHGMVIQRAGQLWSGAAKNDHAQALIEYSSKNYKLKLSIRDDKEGNLLRSLIDIVSSFVMWYFPGRLKNVYVTCTHCISQHLTDPTLFSLDYCEKQASLGNDHVLCRGSNKVEISQLAFEVTVNSNKFSVIPYSDLKMGPQLGSGSFANVYRGLWNQSEVAIKVLNIDEDDDSTERFREFRNEAQITGELHHENIVSLKCVSLNPFCIITELLQFGDLSKFIRNTPDSFSWGLVLRLAIDIAKGMNFLHSCKPKVVHRDLKSANILLGGQSIDTIIAKVSDFGLSIKPFGREVKGRKVWNWRWLAPEIMMNNQYNEKVDVYSFAIVLWELISRDIPFEEYYDDLKWNSILEDKIINGMRPTIPHECPQEMKTLIADCWNGDPRKRPSFDVVLKRLQTMQKTFTLSQKLDFSKHKTTSPEIMLENNSPILVGSPISEITLTPTLGGDTSHSNDFQTSTDGSQGLNNSKTNTNGTNNTDSSSGNGSLSNDGEILTFGQVLHSSIQSTIHCMLFVYLKGEPQVWCGCGDGSIAIFNPITKTITSINKCPDSSRILGMIQVKKSLKHSTLKNSHEDEQFQIWAYFTEGILIYDPKTPSKPYRTIKTNYISCMVDEGDTIWTNCKEKNSSIKVISKSKYKTKKLLSVKTSDTQITSILINHSGITVPASKVWLGTDKGLVFVCEYPSLSPLVHMDSHNGGLVHSIKKVDRFIWTCSERVICVFDEQGILKKKIDGITSRVLSLLPIDNYVVGTCYDSSILVWDSKQNYRLIQRFQKKHNDAISCSILTLSKGIFQVWAGGWDKKISTYTLSSDIELGSSTQQLYQQQHESQSKRVPSLTIDTGGGSPRMLQSNSSPRLPPPSPTSPTNKKTIY